MTVETSARYGLPFLSTGQAQKEVTHNEALALIDLATNIVVEASGTNAPPSSPDEGSCWIVGDTPTGAWSGQAGSIAGWTGGGWRFLTSFEGLSAWDNGSGTLMRFVEGAWGTGAAVAEPSGGSVIDLEARAALANILARLRQQGFILT